jgi:hypothetical protein
VIFDLDDDGDLDIVTTNYGDLPQVFISDLSQRGDVHFLKVKLVGRPVETATVSGGRGRSYGPTAAPRHSSTMARPGTWRRVWMPLYAGLGGATQADSIAVTWPSGRQQTVRGPSNPDRTDHPRTVTQDDGDDGSLPHRPRHHLLGPLSDVAARAY